MNCASCKSLTQQCTACADGYQIALAGTCVETSADCVNYGDPENPAGCIDAWDEDRLLPPFDEDTELVDWRTWGVVNTPRNQGECGACSFFTAVGALESSYAIKYGPLYKLSEQHVVDCARNGQNLGC